MTIRIIAFDLSLASTGWASDAGSGVDAGTFSPPKSHDRGVPRLQWLRDAVISVAGEFDLVVLESYASDAKGNAIASLGELGGVIRCALAGDNIDWIDVPPACRTMFATGRRNASKQDVRAAALRKLAFAGHSPDEANALWLYHMARARYRYEETLTERQTKALASVRWPNLAVEVSE